MAVGRTNAPPSVPFSSLVPLDLEIYRPQVPVILENFTEGSTLSCFKKHELQQHLGENYSEKKGT